MIPCDSMREWIQEYADGTLDEARRAELKTHLAGCPDCARELAELDKVVRQMRALPEIEPPSDLLERVHKQIRSEDAARRAPLRWLMHPQVRLAVAAALLLGIGIYGWVEMRTPKTAPVAGLAPASVAAPDAVEEPAAPPASAAAARPAAEGKTTSSYRAATVRQKDEMAPAVAPAQPVALSEAAASAKLAAPAKPDAKGFVKSRETDGAKAPMAAAAPVPPAAKPSADYRQPAEPFADADRIGVPAQEDRANALRKSAPMAKEQKESATPRPPPAPARAKADMGAAGAGAGMAREGRMWGEQNAAIVTAPSAGMESESVSAEASRPADRLRGAEAGAGHATVMNRAEAEPGPGAAAAPQPAFVAPSGAPAARRTGGVSSAAVAAATLPVGNAFSFTLATTNEQAVLNALAQFRVFPEEKAKRGERVGPDEFGAAPVERGLGAAAADDKSDSERKETVRTLSSRVVRVEMRADRVPTLRARLAQLGRILSENVPADSAKEWKERTAREGARAADRSEGESIVTVTVHLVAP